MGYLSDYCFVFVFHIALFYSKEVNEEVGPKEEKERNLSETAMHPNPPLQDMFDSWMSVENSFEQRDQRSHFQKSRGCWAMSGVNCLLRRNRWWFLLLALGLFWLYLKNDLETGKMAQWLCSLSIPLENWSSFSRSHVRWLTTACSFSFNWSDTLFWPQRHLHRCHIFIHCVCMCTRGERT